MPEDKVYLGDGVYVSLRPVGDVLLETDRSGVTQWIVLGPVEYAALVAFVTAATCWDDPRRV